MLSVLYLIGKVIAAILATWRITDLIVTDRITEKFRKKFPLYLWTCPRCVSVWASLITAVLFKYCPHANFVFALAWLYLWKLENDVQIALHRHGRRFSVGLRSDGGFEILHNDILPSELRQIVDIVHPGVKPSAQPPQ